HPDPFRRTDTVARQARHSGRALQTLDLHSEVYVMPHYSYTLAYATRQGVHEHTQSVQAPTVCWHGDA
ncbi:MAG TPA: hypothetical protein VGL77_17490, partial [Armatimonadota bacterium]